jgi:putative serine protease PepD
MNKPNLDIEAGGPRVIRIPFGWLILISLVFIGLGLLGGLLAQYLIPSRIIQPPNDGQIITTTQQVTISPNKTASEIVRQADASVMLLIDAKQQTPLAMALVLSSDGLLATTVPLSNTPVNAITNTGRRFEVTGVGLDEMFGVYFLRLAGDATPLDLDASDASPGHSLLALGRDEVTATVRAYDAKLAGYTTPIGSDNPGIQRNILVDSNIILPLGTPLINEEGKVVGIISSSDNIALPASHLLESFNRIAKNRREDNLLRTIGISLNYDFSQSTPQDPATFIAQVSSVRSLSPAAIAGIRRGDIITKINSEDVTWQRSILGQLSNNKSITMTVDRQGTEHNIGVSLPGG